MKKSLLFEVFEGAMDLKKQNVKKINVFEDSPDPNNADLEKYQRGQKYKPEDVMDLYDIPKEVVKKWIEKDHGLLFVDFEKDYGQKPMYTGQEVLNWLGY